jgi:polysaccharide pyruvyl transferase WcaK-like protein
MQMILIKGNYGNGNTGDDALAYCIYHEFKARKQNAHLLYKKPLENCYNIPSLPFTIDPKKRINKTIDLFKYTLKGDLLVYGGGSQLQLSKGIGNILNTVKLFKLSGKKVAFLGVGIEEIDPDPKHLSILREIINNSEYFSVRDANSYNIALKLNPNKTVNFSSDPCINFDNLSQIPYRKKVSESNIIDITIVPMDFDVLYILVDKMIESLKNNFPSKKIKFTIVPFAQVDDYAVNKLGNFLREKNNDDLYIEEIEFTHNLFNILEYLENADYLISGRLHGGIVGSLLEKPVIYCASETRNHKHNKNLGSSIGYEDKNFISNSNEVFQIVDDYIKNPQSYIRDEQKFMEARKRLKDDYDRLIAYY